MVKLSPTDGRIELDQHVAGPYRRAVPHMNCPHNPGFGGLDHLGPTINHDLARRGCNHVDPAERGPGQG